MIRRSLFLLLLAAFLCPASHGIEIRRTDQFTLAEDAVQKDELWLVSSGVAEFRGTIEDDLFVVSATGRVDGTCLADVWAVGDEIALGGKADGHARLAGRSVHINGSIEQSLVAVGTSITLDTNGVVRGDVIVVGENVLIAGTVGGNVRVMATTVTVSGKIDGNLRVIAGDTVIVPGAEIGGDLVYSSAEELVLGNGVTLKGQLREAPMPALPITAWRPTLGQAVTIQIFLYLCALLAALPLVGIFPQFTGYAVRALRQSYWKCAFVGLLAFSLTPMIAIFALTTGIGIPLGIILLAIQAIFVYYGKVIVALVLGGILLRRRGPQPFGRVFTALTFGLLILYVLAAAPLLGGAVVILATLTGLGALVLALFASQAQMALPVPAPDAPQPPISRPENPATDNPTNPEDRR